MAPTSRVPAACLRAISPLWDNFEKFFQPQLRTQAVITEVKSKSCVQQNGTRLGPSGEEGKTVGVAGETTYRRTEANEV